MWLFASGQLFNARLLNKVFPHFRGWLIEKCDFSPMAGKKLFLDEIALA